MRAVDDDTALLAQYQVVSARRLQWDNLVWQVPIVSLTAQAFLLVIALGTDTRPLARLAAASLSLVTTVLSMMLMARHRQNEETDAHWLANFEREHFGTDRVVHGVAFRVLRDQTRLRVPGGTLGPFQMQYRTWMWGLTFFGGTAAGAIAWAVVGLLSGA